METDKFNFKQTYNRFADSLINRVTHEAAMSMGVGGEFESMGVVLADLTRFCGLQPGHCLIDIGCGSGRLAKPLAKYLTGLYIGVDVVPAFLSHARNVAGRVDWRFEEAEGLSIPAAASTADMVCFFSVFTHLLHEESYIYLEEAFRVLKPGGKAIVSFLEFPIPSHWAVFGEMVTSRRLSMNKGPLNQFLSRDALRSWASQIGFDVTNIWDGDKPFVPLSVPVRFSEGPVYEHEGTPGQSICLLVKPLDH